MLQVKFDLRLHVQFLFNLLRLIPNFLCLLEPRLFMNNNNILD